MPEFFRSNRELTIAEIATLTGAELGRDVPADRRIRNIAPLDTAGSSDITFFDSKKHLDALAATHAAVCLLAPQFVTAVPPRLPILVTPEPYRAFVAVAEALFPEALRPSSLFGGEGRAATAAVHSSARVESNATIDPMAVIGPRAEIGAGTVIAAGATIGPDVCIGRDCSIGPGVTIVYALIGDRVIIHAGARIGQDGFGYLPGPRGHQKIPQTRRVIIQDDVEIGANSTIDRGGTRDTIIGEGTKIDNLVQIAHNVVVGRHCVIVSLSGVAGSAKLGDFVMVGGQVGISDHLTIGDGVRLGGRSGVMSNVPAGGQWLGYPARPAREWLRSVAVIRRLGRRHSDDGEKA